MPKLSIFLRVPKSASNIISLHALLESEVLIAVGTAQILTQLDLQTDENKDKIKIFNSKISN